MKIELKHPKIGLALTALALLTEAYPVIAGNMIPFDGNETGAFVSDLVPFVFPIAHDGVSGEGVATQIGHYTLSGTFVVNVLLGMGSGPFTMTADNGDMLFLDATGSVVPTDLTKVVWNLTVTGGTGRFENESGSFISQVQLEAVVGSKSPNPYEATLKGAISQAPEGGAGYAILAASSLAGFGLLTRGRKAASVGGPSSFFVRRQTLVPVSAHAWRSERRNDNFAGLRIKPACSGANRLKEDKNRNKQRKKESIRRTYENKTKILESWRHTGRFGSSNACLSRDGRGAELPVQGSRDRRGQRRPF